MSPRSGFHRHRRPVDVSSPAWKAVLILAVLAATACGKSSGDAEARKAATIDSGNAGHAEEVAAGNPLIRLTPEQVRNAGIAVGVAERRSGLGGVQATAQIEAAPNRSAAVAARVPSRIDAIRAVEGERVAPGQVLAILESPELGRAKADYLAALATANVTRETADRERALFERRISAEREWRQAEAEAIRAQAEKEAAENRLHALGLGDADLAALEEERHYTSTMPLRAPIGGVVTGVTASQGQVVGIGDVLFRIVDAREVWLAISIYEQDLGRVRVGQQVEVRTTGDTGPPRTGTVKTVGAVIEPASRSATVRVALSNADGALRPGMFATARLSDSGSPHTDAVLAVPTGAVQRDGERHIVFRPAGPGRFVVQPVELGEPSGGWTPVRQGLQAGDSVVITGAFILKSELRKGELGEEEH